MAALRDRLRGALTQASREERPAADANVTALADLSPLGGRWFESPHGPGYVVESIYEGGYTHGSMALHRALEVDWPLLAHQGRDPRLADQQAGGVRYIDTETTGMGGAGAMVFMAGVARFDGATLRLRQYLLPGPHYEGGLLGGFAEELEDATGLVSYNGKSFDVPSLEARAVLSRMTLPLRELPHLDLLHPNRRLFKRQYDSYRLPEAEQRLLEFEREDDCPSHEAPERYFAFQRTGDPTHIAPVLRHNAWDVLSLVALTARLADECGGSGGALQAARAAAYASEWERAAGYYEAATMVPARAFRLEALEGLARSRWRSGDYAGAAEAWERLLAEPRNRRLLPYVELAKIYEHRLREPSRALGLVEQAVSLVQRGIVRPGPAGGELGMDALQRRCERLRRRTGGV